VLSAQPHRHPVERRLHVAVNRHGIFRGRHLDSGVLRRLRFLQAPSRLFLLRDPRIPHHRLGMGCEPSPASPLMVPGPPGTIPAPSSPLEAEPRPIHGGHAAGVPDHARSGETTWATTRRCKVPCRSPPPELEWRDRADRLSSARDGTPPGKAHTTLHYRVERIASGDRCSRAPSPRSPKTGDHGCQLPATSLVGTGGYLAARLDPRCREMKRQGLRRADLPAWIPSTDGSVINYSRGPSRGTMELADRHRIKRGEVTTAHPYSERAGKRPGASPPAISTEMHQNC